MDWYLKKSVFGLLLILKLHILPWKCCELRWCRVTPSLSFICKKIIMGTEDHMAAVESSFMYTINSFIHERGCTGYWTFVHCWSA